MGIPWKQMVKTAMMAVLLLGMTACAQTLPSDSTGGYVLHFDSMGGTMVQPIVFDGKSIIDIPIFPEKEENIFDGWFVDDGSFQIEFTEDYFVNHPITHDTTVYAKWITHKYTLTFILDGVTVDSLRIAYGSDLSLMEYPDVPEKQGFLFSGWNPMLPDTMPNTNLDIVGDYGWELRYQIVLGHVIIMSVANATLTELVIPDTIGDLPVTSINPDAFVGDECLERIVIPKSVERMSQLFAFEGLPNLKEFIVHADNPNYSSDQGVLYDKEKTMLMKYPAGKTESSFDIPEGVTTIVKHAFEGSSHLESITIPDSIGMIDEGAFYGATGLKSVVIPDGVRSIGAEAFYGACNLTEIVIPDSVSFIGMMAFYHTYSLTEITIPRGMTVLGGGSFYGADGLTEIVIPSSVNCILDNAFWGMNNLTEIVVPASVLVIEDYAFQEASGLRNIHVDSTNPNYSSDQGVLFDKDQTTLLKYPEGKPETEYLIPNGVTQIAYEAFSGVSHLESITIPDSLSTIGDAAFSGATSLKTAVIPEGVTTIGYHAFAGTSLTVILLPDSLTTIRSQAFLGTVISEIVISGNVTHIDGTAFSGMGYLKEIIVDSENPYYSSNQGVFYDKDQTTLILYPEGKTESFFEIPNGVSTIGPYAFRNNDLLEGILIPESVTVVGAEAFRWMGNLTIYAMANFKPDGWAGNWNRSDRPVIWGYTGE